MILKICAPAAPDFVKLCQALDRELAVSDGALYDFYHQFNQLEKLEEAVLIYEGEIAVACGALRIYDAQHIEVKRMYVLPTARRKGYARRILKHLEDGARKRGYAFLILETGHTQNDAIALYLHYGFEITENYVPYTGLSTSLCLSKKLK